MKAGIVMAMVALAAFALSGCDSNTPRVEGGGGSMSLNTVPTQVGVAPSGQEQRVTSDNELASFMVDDAYEVSVVDRKTCISTNTGERAPQVFLTVVQDKTGVDMSEMISSLEEAIYDTYDDQVPSAPVVTSWKKDGVSVASIEYEFFLTERMNKDEAIDAVADAEEAGESLEGSPVFKHYFNGLIYIEKVDGWYYSWFGVYLPEDTVTPDVIKRAMDTTIPLAEPAE